MYQPNLPSQPNRHDYNLASCREKSTAVHGVLTILTFGLWCPIWLMACRQNARIRRAKAKVLRYQSGSSAG